MSQMMAQMDGMGMAKDGQVITTQPKSQMQQIEEMEDAKDAVVSQQPN
jgi:hypothetical protein